MADINETSASVSWNTSETPNGPIDGFEISVVPYELETANWITLGNGDSEFKAADILAGANYTVYAVAYNFDENATRLRSEMAAVHFTTRE